MDVQHGRRGVAGWGTRLDRHLCTCADVRVTYPSKLPCSPAPRVQAFGSLRPRGHSSRPAATAVVRRPAYRHPMNRVPCRALLDRTTTVETHLRDERRARGLRAATSVPPGGCATGNQGPRRGNTLRTPCWIWNIGSCLRHRVLCRDTPLPLCNCIPRYVHVLPLSARQWRPQPTEGGNLGGSRGLLLGQCGGSVYSPADVWVVDDHR